MSFTTLHFDDEDSDNHKSHFAIDFATTPAPNLILNTTSFNLLMEFPLLFRSSNPTTAALTSPKGIGFGIKVAALSTKRRERVSLKRVRASGERGSDGVDGREEIGVGVGVSGRASSSGFMSPAMEVTTFNQGFGEAEFPIWDKIGAVVRLSYGIGELGFIPFL